MSKLQIDKEKGFKKNNLKKNAEKSDWKVEITFLKFESQAKRNASYDMWIKSFFHTN